MLKNYYLHLRVAVKGLRILTKTLRFHIKVLQFKYYFYILQKPSNVSFENFCKLMRFLCNEISQLRRINKKWSLLLEELLILKKLVKKLLLASKLDDFSDKDHDFNHERNHERNHARNLQRDRDR